MKKLIILLLLFPSLSLAEYKIAVVDLNRVINSTDEAKEKRAELEKISKEAIKVYQKRAKEIKELEKKVK